MNDSAQLPLLVPRGSIEALYGGAPPHVEEDTSKAASMEIRLTAPKWRVRVLEYLTRASVYGGATCENVEEALGLRHQSAGPRIRELVQVGLVRDSGLRRLTRSGRSAIVWITANG